MTLESLSLLLAVYGAVLSTILAIRELRKDKRKVSVTCKIWGIVIGGNVTWKLIKVTAVNSGHRPIVIESVGLNISGHKLIDLKPKSESAHLPKQIGDGEPISILFDYAEVEKVFRKLEKPSNFACKLAFVCDAEGTEYKSGKPEFGSEELTL